MKLTQISKKALHEAIIAEAPGTGFLAEDLISIVNAEHIGEWSKPMSAEDLLKETAAWLAKR